MPTSDRPDPIELLQRDDEGRLPELLPIRYARMLVSPFTFFRGAASIMASDLQATPVSGITTQICGDAHLLNFGAFATPERRFVFDVNDFDETTTGAWEWDVKRLASSVEVAGRHLTLKDRERRDAVSACVRSYRERMQAFAAMSVLDVWYARIDEDFVASLVRGADARKRTTRESTTDAHAWPAVERRPDGTLAIADRMPKIFHPPQAATYEAHVRGLFRTYEKALAVERRRLFDRYRFVDAAYDVVGVGSVGTRCSLALFEAAEGDRLWLQIKEARASVYERYAPVTMENHGERVVVGQRLLQSSSDLFLGWAFGDEGRAFYVRQYRDMKTSANVEAMTAQDLARYAAACGWALARAHAKSSGASPAIAAYLGRSSAFDDALVDFADAYADQNERDFDALVAARDAGRVVADPHGAFSAT